MAWTYEQLFNGLSTGDLNGQDSWSGNTAFDVTTTSPYEGANCVGSVLNSDSSITIDRSITGISSGILYVSLKVNRTAGTRRGSFYLLSGTTEVARIFMVYDGTNKFIQMLTNDGATWINIANPITNDTWYRIGIEFDDSAHNNQYRCNVDGGTWSSWYGYYGSPSWTTIDKVRLADEGNNGSGTGTMYWDTISPDYTPSSGSTVNSGFFNFM